LWPGANRLRVSFFGASSEEIFRQGTTMLSNLKVALAVRRMRQAELAAAIGISPSTLSEAIHGRVKLAPHQQQRIAEMLRADPAWLFQAVTHIPALKAETEPAPAIA
jgi:transcriptional regulator with XRE-family HTH domain